MTSAYNFLPAKVIRRPRTTLFFGRQSCQYFFAFLILLTVIIMSLNEFYLTIIKKVENGSMKNSDLEAIICEVFRLSICPKRNTVLKSKIESINKEQLIRNSKDFHLTNKTIIIIIQVHKRAEYLDKLITSLRSVKHISSTLVIFSHDYYSDEINKIVEKIEFAPVMQMFFPLSIQLYPNEFPGTSSKDCVWNMPIAEAKVKGCDGAYTPDAYGHYRQAHITQIKHHWWWKLHRVFEELHITKEFDGYVLFLEEDHYLAPDAIHILELMINLSHQYGCNSLHIGNYKERHKFKDTADKVDIVDWNNLGFAFNRTMWKMLCSCSSVFCTFDDYNWDWSFQYTAQKCFFNELTPLVIHSSRVFHIGDHGVHHTDKECQLFTSLKKATETIKVMLPFLFPENLKFLNTDGHQIQVKKGWGGWADPRDIELCLNITNRRNIS